MNNLLSNYYAIKREDISINADEEYSKLTPEHQEEAKKAKYSWRLNRSAYYRSVVFDLRKEELISEIYQKLTREHQEEAHRNWKYVYPAAQPGVFESYVIRLCRIELEEEASQTKKTAGKIQNFTSNSPQNSEVSDDTEVSDDMEEIMRQVSDIKEIEKQVEEFAQKKTEKQADQKINTKHPEGSFRVLTVQGSPSLLVYETLGDGSCAFHALLGTPNVKGVYQCDTDEARYDFVQWLTGLYDSKRTPLTIKLVLASYFLEFDQAPQDFKTDEVIALHKHLWAMRKQLEQRFNGQKLVTEQDKIEKIFCESPTVFSAYSIHLLNPNTQLLQEELITLAVRHRIPLTLHQFDWNEKQQKASSETFNKLCPGLQVHIWYDRGPNENGQSKGHYERAKPISWDDRGPNKNEQLEGQRAEPISGSDSDTSEDGQLEDHYEKAKSIGWHDRG